VTCIASTTTHNGRFTALCPGLPVWAGTRRNTYPPTILIIIQSLSASSIYHDPASSWFKLRAWQSSCTTSIHFFTQSVGLLFAAHAHTIAACFAVVSVLCHLFLVFLLLLTWNSVFYLNITHPSDHSHLCSLKCLIIFFPDRPGLTSVQHTTSHTAAIQPPSPNQWYIPIGEQWYQLPEFIPSNSNFGLHSCISISIHIQHVTYVAENIHYLHLHQVEHKILPQYSEWFLTVLLGSNISAVHTGFLGCMHVKCPFTGKRSNGDRFAMSGSISICNCMSFCSACLCVSELLC